MNYKETFLWKASLGQCTDQNENKDELQRLPQSFERARENAAYLLKIIRDDFPSLTIHDITHADSLWQTGSVITGPNYEINPLEGYVLGCAFLMHDAVLSYQAAGGMDKLRNEVAWKDFYADYAQKDGMTEPEKLYETDFRTIRFLHATYAEELYSQIFTREDGSSFYIIEEQELRNHLGEIICKIAASHHWNIDELEEKLCDQQPAPAGFPLEWNINPIKLACILRCADAAHIDAGRAPDHLYELLKIYGVSRDHWTAQNHLSQIDISREDPTKVIIKSDYRFKEEESSAWNVAYDAACVLDHEIKNSNNLLHKKHIPEFQARSVCGTESQEAFARYVQAEGWQPCNANIHISNIEGLIHNLGGEKLYGNSNMLEIAIRELLQNSRDAIAARRIREQGFTGKILIAINQDDEKTVVSVTDDGVGMSLITIKDYFLNFGSSFWSSDLAKKEFSGLNSSGFKSVGQFGIGFYAVFMVASQVIVETRKYDSGLDDNIVLKFPKGLCLRPIISKKRSESMAISTKVSFVIDQVKCQWSPQFTVHPGISGMQDYEVPYSSLLANMTAGLDVDVDYSENKKTAIRVHRDINTYELNTSELANWLKEITFSNYQSDNQLSEYIDKNLSRMQKIVVNGKIRGIAAINTLWGVRASSLDVVTVGGLKAPGGGSTNAEFLGCIIVEPSTARRDGDISTLDLTTWAKEQYSALCKKGLSEIEKLMLPYVVGKYGINMIDDMKIVVYSKPDNAYHYLDLSNLLSIMKEKNLELIIPISSDLKPDRVERYLDDIKSKMILNDNELLFWPLENSDFLALEDEKDTFKFTFLYCIKQKAQKMSLKLCLHKERQKVPSKFGVCDGLIIKTEASQL